jgi:hypothetical protein
MGGLGGAEAGVVAAMRETVGVAGKLAAGISEELAGNKVLSGGIFAEFLIFVSGFDS